MKIRVILASFEMLPIQGAEEFQAALLGRWREIFGCFQMQNGRGAAAEIGSLKRCSKEACAPIDAKSPLTNAFFCTMTQKPGRSAFSLPKP